MQHMVRVEDVLHIAQEIVALEAEERRLRQELEEKIQAVQERVQSLKATLAERLAVQQFVPPRRRNDEGATRQSTGDSSSIVQRVREVFADAPGIELTAEDVHARLTGDPADVSTIRSTLIRLHQGGYLDRKHRGKYLLSPTPRGGAGPAFSRPAGTVLPVLVNGSTGHEQDDQHEEATM